MDVKTAIETLEEIILNPTLDDTDEDNLQKIIALLKSLSREAELGRAAVEAIGSHPAKFTTTICLKLPPEITEEYCGSPVCMWHNFCRLRAESGNLDVEQRQPSGIELIAAERQRQISQEGWTPEHDDQHANGELALAAACYAIPSHRRIWDELI
ncbi:hypothetical protein M7775_02505, partial [Sporomusa sphaeroides DSM 2875]|nr:hypothetical protein [Sporomusa sphaeroides DSM 2875]